MRLFGKTLLVTALVSLLVSACGGGTATTAPTATKAPAATAAATSAATAVPATATARPTAVPAPTATALPISVGEIVVPTQFNNYGMIPDNSAGADPVFTTLFDSIVGSSPDGKLDANRGLAVSWTPNADSTAWTFKFRDGVLFHNGDKVTSSDARFLMEFSIREGSKSGKAGPMKTSIKSLATPDDATLVVNLNARDILWPMNYVSSISPPRIPHLLHSEKHFKAVGENGANRQPVGTGPYKLRTLTVGERIVVEAIDKHYFFGVPRTKTVNFWDIPDEATRLAALRNGAGDLAVLTVASSESVRRANLQLFTNADARTATYLIREQYRKEYPNYGRNPFSVKEVRQALHWYGIDREGLVKGFFGGAGEPSVNYPVRSLEVAYEKIPVPPYDQAKAKAMIAAAGWPTGFEMDLVNFTSSGQQIIEMMEAIAVMWERLGLKVNRVSMDEPAWRAKSLARKGGEAWQDRPTVVGSYAIPNVVTATVYASNVHSTAFHWYMNDDPEGDRLANAWITAPNMEDYVRFGKAYQRWEYENVSTFNPIVNFGDFWAATNKIPKQWSIGRGGATSYQEYAFAMRY